MSDLKEKIKKVSNLIRKKSSVKPQVAIILGTGLGALVKEIKHPQVIPYQDIPFFPAPTGLGHKGELFLGKLSNKDVVAMAGRFHYYEGYSLFDITFPVRVMKDLGAKILIVSNASGGLNKNFLSGDLMIVSDQINLMGVNPLIGSNDDSLGPRFPDMFEAYDKKLISLTEKVALDLKIPLRKGIYIAVTGPNLETPAEYSFFSKIGDAVGMSTIPEVIVAIHCGLRVLGISVITDKCSPDALKPANIKEIIEIANKAEPKLSKLVKEVIKRID